MMEKGEAKWNKLIPEPKGCVCVKGIKLNTHTVRKINKSGVFCTFSLPSSAHPRRTITSFFNFQKSLSAAMEEMRPHSLHKRMWKGPGKKSKNPSKIRFRDGLCCWKWTTTHHKLSWQFFPLFLLRRPLQRWAWNHMETKTLQTFAKSILFSELVGMEKKSGEEKFECFDTWMGKFQRFKCWMILSETTWKQKLCFALISNVASHLSLMLSSINCWDQLAAILLLKFYSMFVI